MLYRLIGREFNRRIIKNDSVITKIAKGKIIDCGDKN